MKKKPIERKPRRNYKKELENLRATHAELVRRHEELKTATNVDFVGGQQARALLRQYSQAIDLLIGLRAGNQMMLRVSTKIGGD